MGLILGHNHQGPSKSERLRIGRRPRGLLLQARMKYIEAAHFLKSLPRRGSLSRIAALDVGTKHIGVAVSDESRIVSTPLKTIERLAGSGRNSPAAVEMLAQKLQLLIKEEQLAGFVVGLPLIRGQRSPLCEEIVQLMVQAACYIPTPRTSVDSVVARQKDMMMFTLWDENSSTVEARRLSKALGAKNSTFHKHKDEMAAAVILRSFLEANIR